MERGVIEPPSICTVCGEYAKRIMSHHENYALSRDVIWMCDKCHRSRHKYLDSIGWVDYVEPIKLIEPEALCYSPEVDKDNVVVLSVSGSLQLKDKYGLNDVEIEIVKLKCLGLSLRVIGKQLSRPVTGEMVRLRLKNIERKYNRCNAENKLLEAS